MAYKKMASKRDDGGAQRQNEVLELPIRDGTRD